MSTHSTTRGLKPAIASQPIKDALALLRVINVLYVIGTYMLTARVIRAGRIPLDDKPADSPQ